MQERSHSFATKSQLWLLDPRPNLPSIVKAVKDGFALSEASSTPVILEVRIRSCHVTGAFEASDNQAPPLTVAEALEHPRRRTDRVALPPNTYMHEQEKVNVRLPAALKFIQDNGLNEHFGPKGGKVGLILQGGMYNAVIRALQRLGLADAWGETQIPLYVLNVTYPLVDAEILDFCADKDAVLVVEEGQPDYIEQHIAAILYRNGARCTLTGKGPMPMAGEYTGAAMMDGITAFLRDHGPALLPANLRAPNVEAGGPEIPDLSGIVPIRPPGFCTGCPERPIFAATKLVEQELGAHHIAGDIGCHLFSILPPFEIGSTTMGYGLGPASAAAFNAPGARRSISFLGDGGFWHNGLSSSIGNAVFNQNDGVIVIVDNYYSAATGGQDVLSSRADNKSKSTQHPIADAVKGMGVKWVRQVDHTYDVPRMKELLTEALTTEETGPKVIVASSECMLNKQRRERPIAAKAMKDGKRVVKPRFGVDEDICTGDHACIRLSGCPSPSVKTLDDPLRDDPVAAIDETCVGCGNCGEVADAAVLCPSFYRADVIHNPRLRDRLVAALRGRVIGWLQSRRDRRRLVFRDV
jgi:indolepyruvate ferredoxin oxidoreductase alpha subunit